MNRLRVNQHVNSSKYRVVQYDSWTEWSISANIDQDNVIYSGPTVNCTINEIQGKYKTAKYIIVLSK
jgi:hypothetical protein